LILHSNNSRGKKKRKKKKNKMGSGRRRNNIWEGRNADQATGTHMDCTLRSGWEQEMPSQPQGLGSEGLQLVRRWAVALKASLSSSRASPNEASNQEADEKEGRQALWQQGIAMQINTVRGECYGGRGAKEDGGQHEHGDGGGAQARPMAASPLVPPPAAANLVHGGSLVEGMEGFLAFPGRLGWAGLGGRRFEASGDGVVRGSELREREED
jgi:hypothetical protein